MLRLWAPLFWILISDPGLLYREASITGLGLISEGGRGRSGSGCGVGTQGAGRDIVVDEPDLVVVVSRLQAHGTTRTANPQHRRRGRVGMAMVSVAGGEAGRAGSHGRVGEDWRVLDAGLGEELVVSRTAEAGGRVAVACCGYMSGPTYRYVRDGGCLLYRWWVQGLIYSADGGLTYSALARQYSE